MECILNSVVTATRGGMCLSSLLFAQVKKESREEAGSVPEATWRIDVTARDVAMVMQF